MTLGGAIAIITDRMRELPGVERATNAPEEQLDHEDLPIVIVYPARGSAFFESHGYDGNLGTYRLKSIVTVDIHLDRKKIGLGTALVTGASLVDMAVMKLYQSWVRDKFGGHVLFLGDPDSKEDPIIYEFSNLGWGTMETIGHRIRAKIVTQEDIPS